MIGIVLITHGNLGQVFLEVMTAITGPNDHFKAIGIDLTVDPEIHRQSFESAIDSLDDGAGVLVLTDLFGGSPANLAMSYLGTKNIEVLAGVNLPMMVRLARLNHEVTLSEAARIAQETGHKQIQLASTLLKDDQSQHAYVNAG